MLNFLLHKFIAYWNQLCILDLVDTVAANLSYPGNQFFTKMSKLTKNSINLTVVSISTNSQ